MKKVTKKELKTALKGKENTKTFGLVKKLPTTFNDTIPTGIAKGIVKMKGINSSISGAAKTVVNKERGNTAENKAPVTKSRRRGSGEY